MSRRAPGHAPSRGRSRAGPRAGPGRAAQRRGPPCTPARRSSRAAPPGPVACVRRAQSARRTPGCRAAGSRGETPAGSNARPRGSSSSRCLLGLACCACLGRGGRQRRVQRVEERGAVRQPRGVLRVLLRDAGDQSLDPGRLGPPELGFLAVDVVHDLRDDAERAIVEPEARHERLEGAGIPLVRVLGLEHVEPELAWPRPVSLGGDELELRLRVDEPANEPRARDAIDVDPLPGYPRGTAGRLDAMSWRWVLRLPRTQPRLEPRDLFLGSPTARGPEKVDGDDVNEAPFQPVEIAHDLAAALGCVAQALRGRHDLAVIRVPSGAKQTPIWVSVRPSTKLASQTEASPPPATISRLCHWKSSTVSSDRGSTYTEFLIATAPRRCNLRPTLTRK